MIKPLSGPGTITTRRSVLQASGILGLSGLWSSLPRVDANDPMPMMSTTQNGRIINERTIGLATAKAVIDAAEQKAEEIGVPMNIAVVSREGNLVNFAKMNNAWLASIDIAINKAFTAASLQTATANLAEAVQPEQSLFGLNTTNDGRLVVFGGGIPLTLDGNVVGAIGVSGGTVEQDITVAQAGVDTFENRETNAA